MVGPRWRLGNRRLSADHRHVRIPRPATQTALYGLARGKRVRWIGENRLAEEVTRTGPTPRPCTGPRIRHAS
ncbi:hypothetical protein ACRAWD_21780 [Caulobacter segnis]